MPNPKELRVQENKIYLLRYRELLSKKMQEEYEWEDIADWTDMNFRKLSTLLNEKTKLLFSVSTLKRALGKQESNSSPTDSTLNMLALFLDFEHWEDFKKHITLSQAGENSTPENEVYVEENAQSKILLFVVGHQRKFVALIIFLVSILVIIYIPFSKPKGRLFLKYNKTENAQSEMPYTLVLGYELKNVNLNKDSGRISYHTFKWWDRALPHKEGSENFYMFNPEVYTFYLHINDKIVDSLRVPLITKDWYTIIRKSESDFSLPPHTEEEDSLFIKNGILHFPHPLAKHTFSWISFFNTGNIKSTSMNDMVFEAEIKNTLTNGGLPAYDSKLFLQGENGEKLQVNFTEKGADEYSYVSLNFAHFYGYELGRGNLSTDLKIWRKVKILSKNRLLSIYLDGEQLMEIPYHQDFGKLWGIGFAFRGSGMARNIRVFRSDGSLAYE